MRLLKQQPGFILPLAVIVVAGLLAVAAISTRAVIRSLQQSRLLGASVQAYYAAETTAEFGLYQVRKQHAVSPIDCPVLEPGASCNEQTGLCGATNIACVNASIPWWSSNIAQNVSAAITTSHETSLTATVEPGESFQVDLFQPYQQAGIGAGVSSALIESDTSAAFTLYGQLTVLSWLLHDTVLCAQVPADAPSILRDYVTGAQVQRGVAAVTLTGLLQHSFNPNCLYSIRMSNPLPAGGGATHTFRVTLHSDATATSQPVPIPSRLLLTTQGRYGDSVQTIEVRTALQAPLSGLYDFVLFSEEPIIK